MDGPFYNLKAVVQKTGIPAASLRAWEKRYGLLEPVRKPNGHRVYPHNEIEKLLQVKALLTQGLSISQAAERVKGVHVAPPQPQGGGEVERLRDRLLQAMAACDATACNWVWAEALDMMPVERLCQWMLRPLLESLTPFGRTYLRFRLGSLLLHTTASSRETPLLVPAPEPDNLRPLLAAVLMARRGRPVIYVEGTELPPGFEPAAELADPDETLDRLV